MSRNRKSKPNPHINRSAHQDYTSQVSTTPSDCNGDFVNYLVLVDVVTQYMFTFLILKSIDQESLSEKSDATAPEVPKNEGNGNKSGLPLQGSL